MIKTISRFKMILFLMFMAVLCGTVELKAQNAADEYIYFDLAAGDVIFSGGNYTGYVFVDGAKKKVTASHNADNKYYIYQSSSKTGDYDKNHTGYATTADFNDRQNCRVPNYPALSYGGQPWSEYITNNYDVNGVQVHWKDAISDTYRTGTVYRICFRNNGTYNVVLDNIYSTHEINDTERRSGGITVGIKENNASASDCLSDCKVTLKLKGDNRVANIYYYSGSETDTSELHLTSADGDRSNSGSMTVASYINNFSKNNASCIGCGIGATTSNGYSYRTYFDGGTVFAGMPKCGGTGVWPGSGYVTHVIGSRKQTGVIVNGGRLTAVSNSTAAAIGGGGGYVNIGGKATIDINGGYVYAYNHSIYSTEYKCFVPCVAIGGSSSVEKSAELTTINIRGGHVYAQSMGGCAIGGGGSAKEAGGPANINISGGYVQAKSLAGSINGHSFPAGSSIGGGTGGKNANTNGGDAVFHIDGGTLRVGTIGGGATVSPTGKVGSVKVYITDGDVQAQFMMAAGSTDHCVFEMSGGTLHGSDYTSTSYPLAKSDGGALWMDDPDGVAIISGGEIYENKADKGGAFYMNGGTLDVTGGYIHDNTAITNGGAFFVNGGDVTISDGSVSGNRSTNGGGVYVDGGNFTFTSGNVDGNIASMNGGGAYISSGNVSFKGNLSGNSAANGGGLYLGSGAAMAFQGGLIINNEATMPDGATSAGTAYHGSVSNIMGCGGGIYLKNGTSSENKTTLTFALDPEDRTFGLYTNSANMAGDDIVSEGGYTEVVLPSIRDMQLYGFDGKDATPFWYQDYFTEDERYSETDGHAVDNPVEYVGRFRDIINQFTNEYYNHRIPDERLGTIKNNYLCLTLSYNMLDITLTANHLLGHETALFTLVRHGSTEDKHYDVLIRYDAAKGKASRTLRNMPWGTYSIFPNDAWNWAYEKIAPQQNLRLGETGNYEFIFDMEHKNGAEVPQHDERNR